MTLKLRHSMIGKSVVPVVLRLKAWEEDERPTARLLKSHPLADYTEDELRDEFRKLSGEDAVEVLGLAGLEVTRVHLQRLLHCTILQSNAVGAPKGKTLSRLTGNIYVMWLKHSLYQGYFCEG